MVNWKIFEAFFNIAKKIPPLHRHMHCLSDKFHLSGSIEPNLIQHIQSVVESNPTIWYYNWTIFARAAAGASSPEVGYGAPGEEEVVKPSMK